MLVQLINLENNAYLIEESGMDPLRSDIPRNLVLNCLS